MIICSVCRSGYPDRYGPYCPHCGCGPSATGSHTISSPKDANGRPLGIGSGVRCPGNSIKGKVVPTLDDLPGRVTGVKTAPGEPGGFTVEVEWRGRAARERHWAGELENTD